MKTRNNSLLKVLLTPLLLGIIFVLVVYSSYNYVNEKRNITTQINHELALSIMQLEETLPHFIVSFSINEYQKLIEKQLLFDSLTAITIKDFVSGKVFSKEYEESGKIKFNNEKRVTDYLPKNEIHQDFLKKLNKKDIIIKHDDEKVAEVSIYTNNYLISQLKEDLVNKTFKEIIMLIFAVTIIIYFVIKFSILDDIDKISSSIQNIDDNGLPINKLPITNTKEINQLVLKMNQMIETVKFSKAKIEDINKRYNLTLNSINDGIWDWNFVTNEVYYSSIWKSMLGYNSNEIKNSPETFFNLIEPSFKEQIKLTLEKHLEDPENKTFDIEFKIRTKSGEYIWIQSRGKAILDDNNKPIRMLGVHTNIDSKKRLEFEMKSQKEKYETIQDSANAIIATIQLDGTMNYINKLGEEFTGYKKEEIASKPYFWFDKFVSNDIRPDIKEVIKKISKEKDEVSIRRNSWINKYGEKRVFEWSNSLVLDDNAEPLYLTTIGIDITERETLKEIKKLYNVIEETQSLAKVATINQDFNSNYFNVSKEFYNIWGFEKNTKIDLDKILSLIDTDDLENVLNIIKQIEKVDENQHSIKVSFKIKTNLDEEKYIEAFFTKKYYKEKSSFEFNGIVQDVTEKVLANFKEKEQQAVLIQQSRLALLGEMVSMIAHQWRQPLNTISIWKSNLLTILKENPNDFETIELINGKINESIVYLSKTIDDFKDFYKSKKVLKEFNVNYVIDKTLNIIDGQIINSNVRLITNCDNTIEVISYDNELMQVMISLINNAIEAMDNIEQKVLKINLYKEDKKVYIEIIDNGIGVSEDIQDKIFDPYFTTKDSKNGSGIGLYMSKMIVQKSLKGDLVFVPSQKETIFRITFNLK